MKAIVRCMVVLALFAALVTPAAAKGDMLLDHLSVSENGTVMVTFRSVNGLATVSSGRPQLGWVEGYASIDCNLVGYCYGVMFQQNGTWYNAYWN